MHRPGQAPRASPPWGPGTCLDSSSVFRHTTLFWERFLFRKCPSSAKGVCVWHLAFWTFLFPLEDSVWPFLSTTSWADTMSCSAFICWVLIEKEMHVLLRAEPRRAGRAARLRCREELSWRPHSFLACSDGSKAWVHSLTCSPTCDP